MGPYKIFSRPGSNLRVRIITQNIYFAPIDYIAENFRLWEVTDSHWGRTSAKSSSLSGLMYKSYRPDCFFIVYGYSDRDRKFFWPGEIEVLLVSL